jgi:hypothetical protein
VLEVRPGEWLQAALSGIKPPSGISIRQGADAFRRGVNVGAVRGVRRAAFPVNDRPVPKFWHALAGSAWPWRLPLA